MDVVFLLIGAALGWLIARSLAAPRRGVAPPTVEDADVRSGSAGESAAVAPSGAGSGPSATLAPEPTTPAPDTADAATTTRDAGRPEPPARVRAIQLAKSLDAFCEEADQGSELEREERFGTLVALLSSEAFAAQDRLNWATSRTTALGCAAIAAMAATGDTDRRGLARIVDRMGYMSLHFALRHLAEGKDPVACGLLLMRAKGWWCEHPPIRASFTAFLDRQRELGVAPALDAAENPDNTLEEYTDFLRPMPHPLIDAFLAELGKVERRRRGEREVARVGRLLGGEDELPVAQTRTTRQAVAMLVQSLQRPGRQSFVMVGPDGAGKTTLARAALRELAQQGWRVIEAAPSQMMAGQKFIGEIEERVQNFVDGVGGERAVWFVPECHQLLEAGAWSGNPRGILDLLVPFLERGALQILGESTNAAWARVLTQRPRIEGLLTGIRVEPMDHDEALELARDWGARWRDKLGAEAIPDAIAAEACELARHQFPERVEPGRSFELLKEALATALLAQPPTLPLDREQLLASLARSSGLPLEILDAGRALDVGAVRRFFAERVIGQDEAVDCLVDRIAMLKAGLVDPRRPIGVFLFAGPTGTGKTEIAKTLARYLFGSPDRMLRFDMSEYQSDDAYWRLIEGSDDGRSGSLTARIRQHPFSVILLDEFEKAGPRIWDLFLQVFDDGRLTDRSGNTADFRHSIILLTSNLGSTVARAGGPGFVAQRGGFSRELVQRAIDTTFRREFVNRLDRVVVFNPLTRALMREILGKELREVLERRGFRGREWAVEWEASAVEFLLDEGFTPDLGARPLRRAIDRHLLAPLARTIVEHRVPSGEQFLFVQAGGDGLQVRFVDPDAPAEAGTATPPSASGLQLRALALEPRADRATLDALGRELDARTARLDADDWTSLKNAAALAMQEKDFWQRPERQPVLDRLERMDRIESGLRSARSLHARLDRSAGRGAGDLVRRLALLLRAIDAAIAAVLAGEPEDARIALQPADPRSIACLAWRDRLAQMYVRWGETRGMRVHRAPVDAGTATVALEVSGFGAFQALRDETGLHVLEVRDGDADVRHTVRVRVTPEPSGPEAPAPDAGTRVCRRYDDGPSPLVRDARGWRSGRLDRVLEGDFDLLGEPAA